MSGTRGGDDDVDCASVHSDLAGGTGQDHESTDCARCGLESGNLIQKTKAMVPILVPLFVSAFRRANDLAMAMEARCYNGGDGRTKMKPLIYKCRDYMAYAVTFLYVAAVIGIGRFVPFRIWIF